jgi:hypothetical protein
MFGSIPNCAFLISLVVFSLLLLNNIPSNETHFQPEPLEWSTYGSYFNVKHCI